MNNLQTPNCINILLGVVLLEDCLTTMGKLTDNSVDLIITSPPYNKAGHEGFIRKRHEKDSWSKGRNIEYGGEADNDFMIEAEYQEQIKAEMSDIDNPALDDLPDSSSVDELDLNDIPTIGDDEEDNSISPAGTGDDFDPEEESGNY